MRKGILIAALLVATTILSVVQTGLAETRQSHPAKKDYSKLNVVLYMTAW